MPDQISLFPDSFSLYNEPQKEGLFPGGERERSCLDEHFSRTTVCQNSKEYIDLLKFITKFTKYSPLNCYLIYIQNPFSRYVATANQWLKKFGRKVKPEAKPIVILAPMAPVLFVYDAESTEGKPLPKSLMNPLDSKGRLSDLVWNNTLDNCARDLIKIYERGDSPPDSEVVETLAKAEPVQISEDEIYAALYSIKLNKDDSITRKYAIVVHGLAHLYCGHLGSDKNAWWMNRQKCLDTQVQREIEAESISYLVCKRQKIETPATKYLLDFTKENIELPEFSLDVILRVAGHIENMGKHSVKKRKKKGE